LLFSTSWTRGLLIGAIVAPTDAAAVSALLHLRRLELRARVAALLEVESGINDPVSVLIAVLLVELLVAPVPLPTSHIVALAAREIVGGAAFGIGGGYLLLALVNRLEATTGLYPILALAGSTALFGAAQTAGASGFLAVYLAGLILGGHRHRATQVINQAFDAFAWLSQIVLFLMLGLLVTPSALIPILGPSRALLSSSADPADRTLAIDFAGADGDALPVEALNAALLSNHADLVRAAATYIAHQPTAFAYQFEQPLLKGQVLKSDETKPASLRT
jgi:NhaP-type Na+/H+ and K+/H+ antiporter